jgi:preprotein translocase subunit SecA
MYNKLGGMTGTAFTEAGELWEIKLDVVEIPKTNGTSRQRIFYKTTRENSMLLLKM